MTGTYKDISTSKVIFFKNKKFFLFLDSFANLRKEYNEITASMFSHITAITQEFSNAESKKFFIENILHFKFFPGLIIQHITEDYKKKLYRPQKQTLIDEEKRLKIIPLFDSLSSKQLAVQKMPGPSTYRCNIIIIYRT